MNLDYRNPRSNQYGGIDCEINHPDLGWIPFTAMPDDPEEYGRDIFQALIGVALPYQETET